MSIASLHFAINADTVEFQLENGSDLYELHNSMTPLHTVRHVSVVSSLVMAGIDVEVRDDCGNTPLHTVLSADLALELIRMGANVNSANDIERTPLHCARNADIASILIENGANVNATDIDGSTPLHTAWDDDIVSILIENGAVFPNDVPDHFTILDGFQSCGKIDQYASYFNFNE